MHETLSNIYLDPLEASLIPLDSACKFEMRWSMIVSYMALALLCGLFGQVMNKGLSFIQRKRQKYLIEPEVVRKKECEWDKKNV
ncbi:hypothetical protein BC830DRAFT_1166427 [Chytriomyces sp. MP71]|nr:hypothetical protein BC830DRAFT_1166427 [Chytriomyces sp. MP71]